MYIPLGMLLVLDETEIERKYRVGLAQEELATMLIEKSSLITVMSSSFQSMMSLA